MGGGGGGGGIKLASLGPSLFLLFLLLWRFLLAAYCCQEVSKRGASAHTLAPKNQNQKTRKGGERSRARPKKSESKNEKGRRARAPLAKKNAAALRSTFFKTTMSEKSVGGGGGGRNQIGKPGALSFPSFLLLWRFLLAAYCCQEVLKRGRALTRSPQKIKIKKRKRGARARARAPRKIKPSVTQHFF